MNFLHIEILFITDKNFKETKNYFFKTIKSPDVGVGKKVFLQSHLPLNINISYDFLIQDYIYDS